MFQDPVDQPGFKFFEFKKGSLGTKKTEIIILARISKITKSP
jgi:hypothetical protein